MPNFKKVAEAVAESGLSRAHIYRLIDQNKVPSQTEGRVRKVDVEALKRFVTESASKPRRGRRPGSGKAAQAVRAKSAAAAQSKPAQSKPAPSKSAKKPAKKTARKATRKAAKKTTAPTTAPVVVVATAPKAAPAGRKASARRTTAGRKAAVVKRAVAVTAAAAAGGSDAAFLRSEVDRLWAELEQRRQDHQAESDRLLKIIESLTRRA
ncbi:hypothetical protein [Algihabitans sp.]|uniref:hypothetical protein n=1 Tax=Algihabitans sp. TaxID=2821514 RepID=UPI003BAACE42